MSGALTVHWAYWQKRRDSKLTDGSQKAVYLLAPEMSRLVQDRTSLQHEFLLSTLWYTGAKISEVLSLKEQDFEFHKRGLVVRFGRSGSTRTMYVHSARYQSLVTRVLKELPDIGLGDSQDQTRKILTITRQTASNWLSRRVEKMKQPGEGGFVTFPITFNTFRHSFAFNALLFGIPLDTLQRWLGHNQAEMTRRYLSYFDEDDWTLVQRIDFE